MEVGKDDEESKKKPKKSFDLELSKKLFLAAEVGDMDEVKKLLQCEGVAAQYACAKEGEWGNRLRPPSNHKV